MKRFAAPLAACLLPVALAAGPAGAQTAANGGQPPRPPAPAMPVPDSVVDQARDQNDGRFGPLVRPRTSGQVQETWDQAGPTDAVYVTDLCDDCTYKVRTREFMVTVIELPRGEIIQEADLGDNAGFSVERRGDRRLAVRPAGQGYDTSLVVYGKSGQVYPFYLRAEGFNSVNIPDVVVRIAGAVTVDASPAVAGLGPPTLPQVPAVPPMDLPGAGKADETAGAGEDFVEEAPITADAFHGWGDYTLWGDDTLRPETVFRDDHFTYVRFGDRWDDLELPTAYVVVDDIDELVNSRVDGTTFIIESTRPLITLKSGKSYLCIRYEGDA